MKRFKNILLVCDFEVKQQMAVERAVSLAKQNEADLTVYTVVRDLPADARMLITVMPPQELLEMVIADHREKVDALAAEIRRQGVAVSSDVVIGTPFIEVIRRVLRDKHDLVIVAAEGRGGLKERLFGTTSMHLMRKCPCPVWVIKRAQTRPYTRILAAVDPSTRDPERDSLNPKILQLAGSMARMESAELQIVHVWHLFGESYVSNRMSEQNIQEAKAHDKEQCKRRFDNLLGRADFTDLKSHLHLVEGYPEDRIPELVAAQGIDLLVMGTVCRTGIAGFLIGNTAEEVLNQVDCSVLTVKPEGFVTPVTLE